MRVALRRAAGAASPAPPAPGCARRGARRGDHDAQPAAQQRLDRLDPLAGDLVVRLVLAQRLALRDRAPRPRRTGTARSVSQRSASAGVGATTASSRWGDDRTSAAASTAPLEPGRPPRSSDCPAAGQARRQVDGRPRSARRRRAAGAGSCCGVPSTLASPTSASPSTSASQSSGPRRSPARAGGECRSRARHRATTIVRATPERPHLRIARLLQHGLARVGVGGDARRRCRAPQQVVEPGVGRPKRPPPSTGQRRAPLHARPTTQVGQRYRLARRATVSDDDLAAGQPVEQHIHEGHEPGLEAAARSTPGRAGCPGAARRRSAPATARRAAVTSTPVRPLPPDWSRSRWNSRVGREHVVAVGAARRGRLAVAPGDPAALELAIERAQATPGPPAAG